MEQVGQAGQVDAPAHEGRMKLPRRPVSVRGSRSTTPNGRIDARSAG